MIGRFDVGTFDNSLYDVSVVYTAPEDIIIKYNNVLSISANSFIKEQGNSTEAIYENPFEGQYILRQNIDQYTDSGGGGIIFIDNNTVAVFGITEEIMALDEHMVPEKIYVPVGTVLNIYDVFSWSHKTNLDRYIKKENIYIDTTNVSVTGSISYVLEGPDEGQFTFNGPGTVTITNDEPSDKQSQQTVTIVCYTVPDDTGIGTGGDL